MSASTSLSISLGLEDIELRCTAFVHRKLHNSIVTLLRSIKADVETSMDDYEALLRADRATKSALVSIDATSSLCLLGDSIDLSEAALKGLSGTYRCIWALDNDRATANTFISRVPTETIRYVFQYGADDHPAVNRRRGPSQCGYI